MVSMTCWTATGGAGADPLFVEPEVHEGVEQLDMSPNPIELNKGPIVPKVVSIVEAKSGEQDANWSLMQQTALFHF